MNTLAVVNILIIIFAYLLKDYNPTYTILGLLLIAIIIMLFTIKAKNKYLGQKAPLLPVNSKLLKKLEKQNRAKKINTIRTERSLKN